MTKRHKFLLLATFFVAWPAESSSAQSKILRGQERGCSSVLSAKVCIPPTGEPEFYLLNSKSKLLDDVRPLSAGNPLKIEGGRTKVTVTLGGSNNWKYPFDQFDSLTFRLKGGRALGAQFVDVGILDCGDFKSIRRTVIDARTGQFEIRLIEGSERRFHGNVRGYRGSILNLRFADLFNMVGQTMTDEQVCKRAGLA